MWIELLTITLPALTGILGWMAGRKKQNNDFIHDLQGTINMLVDENTKLLAEIVEVKNQNAYIKCELEAMRLENRNLLNQVETLKK